VGFPGYAVYWDEGFLSFWQILFYPLGDPQIYSPCKTTRIFLSKHEENFTPLRDVTLRPDLPNSTGDITVSNNEPGEANMFIFCPKSAFA
jgi:hypothetical protein